MMKVLYTIVVVSVLVEVFCIASVQGSCYFNCMRELIRCNRSGKEGCCEQFKNVCAKDCNIFDAKCRDSKRGSWNKRFYPSDDLEQYEEYLPFLRK